MTVRSRRERVVRALMIIGLSCGVVGVTLGYVSNPSLLDLVILASFALNGAVWCATSLWSRHERLTRREHDHTTGTDDPEAPPEARTPGRPPNVLLVAVAGFVPGAIVSALAGMSILQAVSWGMAIAGVVLALVSFTLFVRDVYERRDGSEGRPDP